MKFILKQLDEALSDEKQELTIVETTEQPIGKTNLKEIRDALFRHKEVLEQTQKSIIDLAQQERDAVEVISKATVKPIKK